MHQKYLLFRDDGNTQWRNYGGGGAPIGWQKKSESDSRVIKLLLKSTWNGNQEIKYLCQDFNNQMFKEIVWNIAQKAPLKYQQNIEGNNSFRMWKCEKFLSSLAPLYRTYTFSQC